MTKGKGNILIVDDDEYVLLSLKLFFEQHFSLVTVISTPELILSKLEKGEHDVVLLDMNFRQGDTSSTQGLFWLRKIIASYPETQVISMTAFGEIDLAVETIKEGAIDFVVKPWENEKLLATVSHALALSFEKKKVQSLKSRQKAISSVIDSQYPALLGKADVMVSLSQSINKISATDAEVLLLGENGTGKEVVARTIHRNSRRANEVFISVDLGALTEQLFESELFGHKKGAFTDAKEDRVGRIEAAQGGTLFLDEIGNLPTSLQSKLLTFLQTRKIVRVGTNDPIEIDVRIICATNANLQKLVAEGEFREDLFYRINTVELTVPPLRERPSDISILTEHFLKTFSHKYQKPIKPLDTETLNQLTSYKWPGNVRELQHAIERAVIMADTSTLTVKDFGFLSDSGNSGLPFDDYNLERVEAWAIRNAIRKHNGNISHAAEELGLSRGALYRRMDRYGI